jgi:hypothetical protein
MPVPSSAFVFTPFDIVSRDGRPRWVVGGSTRGHITLEWRKGAWTDVSVRKGGFRGLTGGISPSAGIMVGAGYRRPATRGLAPIAGRFGTVGWRDDAVPAPPGEAAVTGVALSGGTPWAVGTLIARGRSKAFALRRAQGSWRRADPDVSARESALSGIAQAPGGALWAAGWKTVSGGRWAPLVLRRSGTRWVTVATPSLGGSAVLTDIAFRTAREGWASGFVVPRGTSSYRPYLLRWNGESWRRAALPWADEAPAVIRGVAVGDDGRVWLAGSFIATSEREARGFVAVRSDGSWAVRELGVPADVRSEMHAVTALRSGAMAVGTVGSTSVIIETCPLEIASARGRIRVGDMRARRDAGTVEDDEEEAPSGDRDVSAAALPPLPAAVAPTGFRVRDVTTAAGIERRSRTYGGLVADFDGDGRADIFFSRHGRITPRLYLGRGGGFERAPDTAFSVVDRHGCTSGDANGDGVLDIFCVVGRSRGTALHRHELSLGPAGPDPRLARAALGAADPFGRGRKATFIDLDGDGDPDLFVTTSPDRVDGIPGTNRFFRNVGGRFVAAPEVGLDRNVGGLCAVAADIDGDGDEDLLHCVSQPDDGRPAGLRIRRNEKGKLPDRTAALGVTPLADRDVLVVDLTGDGRPDLVQLSAGRLRVSRGTATGFVPRFEARVRNGVAVGAGDVNGDGLPDLYVVTAGDGNDPDLLLVNRRKAREFVSVRIPQASDGKGDDVLVLDYDGNGLADFLVLNGRPAAGPVQLLASFPKP